MEALQGILDDVALNAIMPQPLKETHADALQRLQQLREPAIVTAVVLNSMIALWRKVTQPDERATLCSGAYTLAANTPEVPKALIDLLESAKNGRSNFETT